jgi:hypothetical protein
VRQIDAGHFEIEIQRHTWKLQEVRYTQLPFVCGRKTTQTGARNRQLLFERNHFGFIDKRRSKTC